MFWRLSRMQGTSWCHGWCAQVKRISLWLEAVFIMWVCTSLLWPAPSGQRSFWCSGQMWPRRPRNAFLRWFWTISCGDPGQIQHWGMLRLQRPFWPHYCQLPMISRSRRSARLIQLGQNYMKRFWCRAMQLGSALSFLQTWVKTIHTKAKLMNQQVVWFRKDDMIPMIPMKWYYMLCYDVLCVCCMLI